MPDLLSLYFYANLLKRLGVKDINLYNIPREQLQLSPP